MVVHTLKPKHPPPAPHSTSTDRYANVDVGVLLYHIERYPGIIILTTNLIDNIDKAFFRRLRYILHLDIPPRNLRVKLWKVRPSISLVCPVVVVIVLDCMSHDCHMTCS